MDAITTSSGGMVGEVLLASGMPSCPRCERCGCGLVCDPGQIPICSTCAPAEVAELRAELTELRAMLRAHAVKLPRDLSMRFRLLRIRPARKTPLIGGGP